MADGAGEEALHGSSMVVGADRIELRGLRALGTHGLLPEEGHRGQPFEVDLDLYVDLRRAGRTDDVGDSVDYGQVCQAVVDVLQGAHADLLERLADEIAERALALASGRASSVVVTVRKLRPPVAADMSSAAVRICRP